MPKWHVLGSKGLGFVGLKGGGEAEGGSFGVGRFHLQVSSPAVRKWERLAGLVCGSPYQKLQQSTVNSGLLSPSEVFK